MCAVGETAKAEALASLKVSEDKSKVLHGHAVSHSEQTTNADEKPTTWKCSLEKTSKLLTVYSPLYIIREAEPGQCLTGLLEKWEMILQTYHLTGQIV